MTPVASAKFLGTTIEIVGTILRYHRALAGFIGGPGRERERYLSGIRVTLPNVLTFLRLLAAPVAIGFILAERMEVALALFVAASVTDAIDGFLARVLRQQSRLGAFIDPLADKSLLLGSYLALTYVGRVPGWLTAAIVVRDVLIIAAVVILYRRIGRFTMTPSLPGKVSTFVQMVTAAAVLLAGTLPELTVPLRDLYYLTAGISVVSGTHYITVGLRLAEEGESLD